MGKMQHPINLYFLRLYLENISDVNDANELTFKEVFNSFAAIAWNLVAKHNLQQASVYAKKATVQRKIEDFQSKYKIPSEWNYEKINAEQREILNKEIKVAGKVNVVGATFGDFNEQIYSFNKKTEMIKMNPLYVEFFLKYKRMLVDVNNYQFALYLEKNNPQGELNGLLTKIETVSQRNSLKKFEVILRECEPDICFYCKKELKRVVHVDHFIPWSYVQNDRLCNFVLACQSCNQKKSDKLASEEYLNILIERNQILMKEKVYEEYFKNYHKDILLKSYTYAQYNGFKRL